MTDEACAFYRHVDTAHPSQALADGCFPHNFQPQQAHKTGIVICTGKLVAMFTNANPSRPRYHAARYSLYADVDLAGHKCNNKPIRIQGSDQFVFHPRFYLGTRRISR